MSNDAPAATRGTFVDFKVVRTRDVCQFVIEMPREVAFSALEMLGGLPRPDQETWVAMVRLVPPDEPPPAPAPLRKLARKPESEEDPAKVIARASIRVKDPEFQDWLLGSGTPDGELPAEREKLTLEMLRVRLNIASRRDLLQPGPYARWQALMTAYEHHYQFKE